MLTTVRLYGHLRARFGAEFELDVEVLSEICGAALPANLPGFREYLMKHSDPGYFVVVNGESRTIEELALVVSTPTVVQIVPAIRGAASGKAIGSLIGGILLAAVSYGAGSFLAAGSFAATVASAGVGIGISLAVGGVAGLLSETSAPAAMATPSAQKNILNSSTIGAGIGTPGQGMVMPVRFGRQAVSGLPVSVRVTLTHPVEND